MTEQRPANPPRHITLVCFALNAAQLHKQPWHSVWGIAHGLRQNGFAISLVTDAATPPVSESVQVVTVDRLYDGATPSLQLLDALQSLNPDRIIVTAGTQELLRPQRFALGAPVSLLLANQRFLTHELRRLRLAEWRHEWRMLKMPLVQSLLPAPLLRWGAKKAAVSHLVYLSEAAQKRHADAGLAPGSVIQPRVNAEFLPTETLSTTPSMNTATTAANNGKVFCHFGSPLLLRGVKDVVSAFVLACAQGLEGKLKLYLRVDDDYTRQRAAEIRQHIETVATAYMQRIDCVERKLSPSELNVELSQADVFVLPFKLTVSDVPLVVIEAAMSGKPVITFDTPGVSEWRRVFPNIILSSPKELAVTMQRAATASVPVATDMQQWTDWKLALAPLSGALRQPLDCSALRRYRMICLIGIDGSGKSTLLAKLSEQLGLQQIAHGYIWSRFRNYLSKPLLALTRLSGHNRKVVIDGVRMGLHDFADPPWLAHLFLLLQKCDMRLDMELRYRPQLSQQDMILGDRCPLDTLVDLAIDTGMEDKILGNYGKQIFAALPQPALIVMVTRDAEATRKSRPDIAADPNYARRATLYNKLAAGFGLPVLHNNGTIEQSLSQLCEIARNPTDAQFAARL